MCISSRVYSVNLIPLSFIKLRALVAVFATGYLLVGA